VAETIPGTIHGRTIELDADPGLAEGQKVQITIRAAAGEDARLAAIEGTAGSMADDPEFDAVMADIAHQRKSTRYRDIAG
jgi:hypothetical protein